MKRFFRKLREVFKEQEQAVHVGIVRDKHGRTKVYLNGNEYKKSNSTLQFWVRDNDLNKLAWDIKNVK